MLRKMLFALTLVLLSAFMAFAGGQGESKALTKMTYITPRGTLEVMDDYFLWVAIDQGYFKELGLNIDMEPGPVDAFACTKFVDQKKGDVGEPSPGVLTASVEQGMDVIMVYEMMLGNVFDFAVRKDSPIKSVQDLAGKTIALGAIGFEVISDPLLVEAGVDPKTVKYVAIGEQVGQAVAEGKVDAALSWEGPGAVGGAGDKPALDAGAGLLEDAH